MTVELSDEDRRRLGRGPEGVEQLLLELQAHRAAKDAHHQIPVTLVHDHTKVVGLMLLNFDERREAILPSDWPSRFAFYPGYRMSADRRSLTIMEVSLGLRPPGERYWNGTPDNGASSMFSNVIGCARCGHEHNRLVFEQFIEPVVEGDGTTWTHWARCPTNGQPILLRTDEGNVKYRKGI